MADRASVYRHAHALGLFLKRQRNIRAALERIIEHAGEVEVTASGVVSAVQAYSKINAAGQWIQRSEHVNLNELFERMTQQELVSSCPSLRQSLRPNHLPMARNAVSALRVRSACRSGSHKLRPMRCISVWSFNTNRTVPSGSVTSVVGQRSGRKDALRAVRYCGECQANQLSGWR